jgi:hypothetical protein
MYLYQEHTIVPLGLNLHLPLMLLLNIT